MNTRGYLLQVCIALHRLREFCLQSGQTQTVLLCNKTRFALIHSNSVWSAVCSSQWQWIKGGGKKSTKYPWRAADNIWELFDELACAGDDFIGLLLCGVSGEKKNRRRKTERREHIRIIQIHKTSQSVFSHKLYSSYIILGTREKHQKMHLTHEYFHTSTPMLFRQLAYIHLTTISQITQQHVEYFKFLVSITKNCE